MCCMRVASLLDRTVCRSMRSSAANCTIFTQHVLALHQQPRQSFTARTHNPQRLGSAETTETATDLVSHAVVESTAQSVSGSSLVSRAAFDYNYMAAPGFVAAITLEKSLLGGIVLGIAVAGKVLMTGRILGMSGTVRGLLVGNFAAWRISFMAGLAMGAAALTLTLPTAFQALPETFTLVRASVAGLLVGFGSSMGSGCTSGHGICGNARFSKRSMVATFVFIGAAMVVSTLANTAHVVGATAHGPLSRVHLSQELSTFAAYLIGGALTTLMGLRGLAATAILPKAALSNLTEFACGVIFAMGLGLSGMLQPAKVASFLSPLSPAFDPSLMMVMGGALLVATPIFQWVLRRGTAPVCSAAFDFPKNTVLDVPLLLGSALFGSGWGLGGICPAPALVNLASPTPQGVVFVAAMVAGMMLHARNSGTWNQLLKNIQPRSAIKAAGRSA